jgi:hypothetical protein
VEKKEPNPTAQGKIQNLIRSIDSAIGSIDSEIENGVTPQESEALSMLAVELDQVAHRAKDAVETQGRKERASKLAKTPHK